MKKIVVTQLMEFTPEQAKRINKLGKVIEYKELAKNHEEWLDRIKDADVICTGKFGFKQKWRELHDTFVSLPFVGVGFLDPGVLKENNVIVSRSPGCNRHAVSEWIIAMILVMARRLDTYINVESLPADQLPANAFGLFEKNITILGKGFIGSRVGEIASALGMNVTYFKRDEDLGKSVENAEVIVNTLSSNSSTKNILDKEFFNSLKKNSYFVTVTSYEIFDQDALFKALDSGILAGAAADCASAQVGSTDSPDYTVMKNHPKILATPHIAAFTDVAERIRNDMMIDNIEAWLNGKPQNVV